MKVAAKPSTSAGGTSPSIGQPKLQDSETFTGTRASADRRTTCSSWATEAARPMRRLARLCVSEQDITRLNSSGGVASARSTPRTFGTSTVYSTPGTRAMRRITSSASASIGIAFGEVNEVTSIFASPVRDSASTKATLSSVETKVASACRPSRIATSCRCTLRPGSIVSPSISPPPCRSRSPSAPPAPRSPLR